MTTICDDLRKAVLQAAIQGKLTEQLPEDGNAEDLYNEIQKEKQKLIREGKVKKEKPLHEITDDIPFDIPENWKWVRTGEVIKNVQYGTAKKSSKTGLVPVLRMGNIKNGKIDYSSLVYTSDAGEINHYALQKDDLLFNRTNSREQVGKVAIYKAERPAIYAGYLVRITPIQFNSDYLNYVMQTSYYWEYCQAVKSDAIGQSNINAEKLKNFVFPLPPLAEQKRIVACVDELMKRIDEMEKTEKDITALYDAFPRDMKAALLQAAIQGKLTEQLPEDGNAEDLYKQIQEEKQRLIKEGKIKKDKNESYIFRRDNSHYEKLRDYERCIDEEISFEIPENWIWVRLGNITTYSQPKPKISSNMITADMWTLDLEDIEKGTGRILSYIKTSQRRISGDKVFFYKGQILYSKLRPYLKKILIAPEEGICTTEIVPFDCYIISPLYLLFVLKSPYVDSIVNAAAYGVKMPRVGTDTMINILVPIPPLAEQERIVTRLDSLLRLVDNL